MVKKLLFKLLLVISSTILTVILLMLVANFYFKVFYQDKLQHSKAWMFNYLSFNAQSIFTAKSWCELFPNECTKTEDLFLPFPKLVVSNDAEVKEADCKKFLFVGDSFTTAPWVEAEESYIYIFLKRYLEQYHQCAVGFRLAFGGANTSQEFYAFTQIIPKLKIDVLIWQFYWNDQIENIKEEVFYVDDHGQLKHRAPWKNMLFIAGFLNEHVPLMKDSALGNYLLYLAETDDPFNYLKFDYNDVEKTTTFNQQLITKIFSEMDQYSQSYHFAWYTTLSPLECEVANLSAQKCAFRLDLQRNLRNLLSHYPNYLGLDYVDKSLVSGETLTGFNLETNYQNLFDSVNDKTEVGSRHLSAEGNRFFGENIFYNFTLK